MSDIEHTITLKMLVRVINITETLYRETSGDLSSSDYCNLLKYCGSVFEHIGKVSISSHNNSIRVSNGFMRSAYNLYDLADSIVHV